MTQEFNLWASKLFMSNGHTRYCGLVRETHVES
jgi:hypothetical protein